MEFDLIYTTKLGGNWDQEFVVVRQKVVYLRIVGPDTNYRYRVMTATAGEDERSYPICQDKERLWEAATQLASAHGCPGDAHKDTKGRVYIRLFDVSQTRGDSDEVFTNFVEDLMREFFAIYDGLGAEANS